MFKKKFFFIVFEGIEGSGKSYQVKKLSKKLKKIGFSTIITREPGGTPSAEKIRKLILNDYFHKNSKEKFSDKRLVVVDDLELPSFIKSNREKYYNWFI